MIEQKSMACTGPERSLKKDHVLKKSLKIEKFWHILEKSLNFPQKSLKKCFAQRKDWKGSSTKIFLVTMKVRFHKISKFPA